MVAPGKRGNAVRLTKPVVEMLMKLNDGFEASTYFQGKNFREERRYRISDGELRYRSIGKTSWADSRFDKEYVADKDQTLRFPRKFMDRLKAN